MSNEKGKFVIDDMILTKEQAMSYFGIVPLIHSSGKQDERWRWPDGILPYSFDPIYPFSPFQKSAIRYWISKFNKMMHGCLKIV